MQIKIAIILLITIAITIGTMSSKRDSLRTFEHLKDQSLKFPNSNLQTQWFPYLKLLELLFTSYFCIIASIKCIIIVAPIINIIVTKLYNIVLMPDNHPFFLRNWEKRLINETADKTAVMQIII